MRKTGAHTHKPILNLADVELLERPSALAPTGPAAERYAARMGMIGAKLGAQKLGYNLTEIPPGRRAFPFHNHRVNEEMFLILEGTGEVRIGSQTHAVRAGDVIACPAGGREAAHQIINTGTSPLRYLGVSTKLSPEIAEYPDSGKFGVLAEFPPGADGQAQGFRFVGRSGNEVAYWEGE
ncbi:cupin domain-containing protein [Solimonas flava]|uniref:cupin domain-containing protein n=1 Tax=Solimonas flava TaxID=415849 RepID=UPI000489FF1D